MIACVNEVLSIARKTLKGTQRKRVPLEIGEDESCCINVVRLLLEPFAELTNDLQGDGVTSSLAILGLMNAIKSKFTYIIL